MMFRIVTGTLVLLLMTQAAVQAAGPAGDQANPKPTGSSDGDKTTPPPGFSAQEIAPLRDGKNYWPGYLLINSTQAADGKSTAGQMKVCYVIARTADLGDGTLVGTIPPGKQIYLLCTDPEKLPPQ